MILPADLIIRGKWFLPIKYDSDEKLLDILEGIRKRADEYLSAEYFSTDVFMFIPVFSRKYTIRYPKLGLPGAASYLSLKSKIKLRLGFLSESDANTEIYFSWLKTRVDDLIFELDFLSYIGSYKSQKGVFIEVVAKPAAYQKMIQLGYKIRDITYYLNIINSVKIEIEALVKKILAHYPITVEEPNPIGKSIYDTFFEELEELGFKKTLNELKEVLQLKEDGKHILALDILRAAVDTFIKEFLYIKRIEDETIFEKVINPEEFIKKLKETGFIDEKEESLLKKILKRDIWGILSSYDHRQVSEKDYKGINKHYVELLYGLVNEFMKFLLKKAIYYDVSIKDRNERTTN